MEKYGSVFVYLLTCIIYELDTKNDIQSFANLKCDTHTLNRPYFDCPVLSFCFVRGKRNNPKLPRPRGPDHPCDAITYNPYHLWWIPLSTTAFPAAKTLEEATGVLIHVAIRHCQSQKIPEECEGKERDQCPWQTCRSGSSKGCIIRADRIVLFVIQIRLSYLALQRPWISREPRR